MFDRISISFRKRYGPAETCESVVLFARHLGPDLIVHACTYLGELRLRHVPSQAAGPGPLAQLDPHTVMVDFIRWFTKDWDRASDHLFLGKHEGDGDNSENGHVILDLDSWSCMCLKDGTLRAVDHVLHAPRAGSADARRR